jgi:hypothetical protein
VCVASCQSEYNDDDDDDDDDEYENHVPLGTGFKNVHNINLECKMSGRSVNLI